MRFFHPGIDSFPRAVANEEIKQNKTHIYSNKSFKCVDQFTHLYTLDLKTKHIFECMICPCLATDDMTRGTHKRLCSNGVSTTRATTRTSASRTSRRVGLMAWHSAPSFTTSYPIHLTMKPWRQPIDDTILNWHLKQPRKLANLLANLFFKYY